MFKVIGGIVLLLVLESKCYDIPDVDIKALCSQGILITLPDSPGVKYVAVQANLNEVIIWPSLGMYSNASTKSDKNGRWIVHLSDILIKVGDVLHYWVHVIYRQTSMHTSALSWIFNVDPCDGDCELSRTKVLNAEKPICQGDLIFSEEFNEPGSFNSWTHDIAAPDSEFEILINNRSNSFIRDGSLHVRATLTSDWLGEDTLLHGAINLSDSGCCGGDNESCYVQSVGGLILSPTLSARLTTRHTFSFMFGQLEFRALLPRGLWLWPEITLRPKFHVYGKGDDISGVLAPLWGTQNNVLAILGGGKLQSPYAQGNVLAGQFNIYKLNWSPEKLEFFINDKAVGIFTHGNTGIWTEANVSQQVLQIYQLYGTTMAPFDQMFYISMSLTVGGVNGNFADGFLGMRKPWNNSSPTARLDFWESRAEWLPSWQLGGAELLVDYIRVRAL